MRVYKSARTYRFILFTLLFVACEMISPKSKVPVVAEVGTKQLTQTDLNEVIPAGLNKTDSSLLANEYINKWIKQELLVQKAEENLSIEQKNLSREIREYRNSLIIYRYKNELMKQRMDTVVSINEINEYYNANLSNFILSRNIVKAIFIKIPGEYANPEQLKLFCSDTSEEGLNGLRDYCLQYAKQFDIFMDNWVDFDIVSKNLPLEINNEQDWLKRNKTAELNDSDYYYLVSIHDYKLQGEIAPVKYVEENISNLILNKRKVDFLKEIENNIYSEGVRKNKFKIYKQETNEKD